ncbi:scavenger receptor class B member 1-like [Vanessa atalanta]|uniref:scavenger receptor class B member 1-like n=1 Tax=Vanessa atalanta TaxID=42275 RepID=UPI001FCD1B9C|nr:scavenger receptor class B member 1-like [Vanessa atalanta]
MVVGAKKAIQHVPSKGKISIRKLQSFTVKKRQSVIRVVYGSLLVIFSVVLAAINPIEVFTNWYLDIQEGKFIYRMWQNPTYEVFSDVYIFNYTNTEEFLNGDATQFEIDEIGPFKFQELRTNENITVNKELGVMTMNPKTRLEFLPEQSVAHYKDVKIMVPNIALIAISTLLADHMGYFANVGAYYSISALGSKLFMNMTAEGLLWGYDDPIVTIASRLLPGWIDFGKIGIMDRFYAQRKDEVEVELRNKSQRYSIKSWNKLPGLPEQGYTDWNTSILCNRVKGTYEGLMLPPNIDKTLDLPVFRKQACRVYPFIFQEERKSQYGFNLYRYKMDETAFNNTSPYACTCSSNCLPDGFVDISSCYYGFPIALSKPHYMDADPEQQSFFKGFKPDRQKHMSVVEIEPILGVPLAVTTNIQVNIAVRTSSGNPITKPLKDKVMPILWLSLYCKEPPPEVLYLLNLRLVIAPPLVITLEVILFIVGLFLGVQGGHRLWKPKYKLVNTKENNKPRKTIERRKSSVILNMSDNNGFIDDQELAKEAVSLLAITEEDGLIPDLLLNE